MQPASNDALRARREKIVLDHFADEVSQDFDKVLSTFPHPHYELIPQGVVHDGREEVMQYYLDTRKAFPDQRHEMIQLRHSDDAVITEFWLLGTHRGYLGGIPPTGNTFRVRMNAFFIFEGDRLVCERIYFDALSMLRQLIGKVDWKRPSDIVRVVRTLRGAMKMVRGSGA
jgi:steroid delta-isomerase-like uncharacterized protein